MEVGFVGLGGVIAPKRARVSAVSGYRRECARRPRRKVRLAESVSSDEGKVFAESSKEVVNAISDEEISEGDHLQQKGFKQWRYRVFFGLYAS